MGTLEQVMQLKNQGMADAQIIGALQQQGISPKEINDAISQAQIKSAVGSPEQPQQMEQSITEGAAPAPIAETQAVAPAPVEAAPAPQETYAPTEIHYCNWHASHPGRPAPRPGTRTASSRPARRGNRQFTSCRDHGHDADACRPDVARSDQQVNRDRTRPF